MTSKYRPWSLLALTLVIAACGRSEVVVSSLPPQTTATASPASSTSAPTATTTASVTVVPTDLRPWGGSVPGAHLTVMVLDGWSAFDGFVAKGDADDPPNWMALGSSSVANIYSDRCEWIGALLDPPPGPTVDDLANAFAEIWGSDATTPTDVMVDGFAGKQVVLTVPTDVNFADCVSGHFMSWRDSGGGDRWYQGPGQIEQLWILDVEGERLLIGATYFPEATPQDRVELQQIIDSIQIDISTLAPGSDDSRVGGMRAE